MQCPEESEEPRENPRLHPDRAAGGHCHHRHSHCLARAGEIKSARGRRAHAVCQQHEANRPGLQLLALGEFGHLLPQHLECHRHRSGNVIAASLFREQRQLHTLPPGDACRPVGQRFANHHGDHRGRIRLSTRPRPSTASLIITRSPPELAGWPGPTRPGPASACPTTARSATPLRPCGSALATAPAPWPALRPVQLFLRL